MLRWADQVSVAGGRAVPGRRDGTQNERSEKTSRCVWGHLEGSGPAQAEEGWGMPGQGGAGISQRAWGEGALGAGDDGQAGEGLWPQSIAVGPPARCFRSGQLGAELERAWARCSDRISHS